MRWRGCGFFFPFFFFYRRGESADGNRMPCRWHEKQIVVLENVLIDEPYTPDRVRSQDKNALSRVKKVVRSPSPTHTLLLHRC